MTPNHAAASAAVRAAVPADRAALTRLWSEAMLGWRQGPWSAAQLRGDAERAASDALPRCLADGCVLGIERQGRWVASSAVDLDAGALLGPFVAPGHQGQGLGRRLVAEAERRAAAFQLFRLSVFAFRPAIPFFEACGYRALDGTQPGQNDSGLPGLALRRHFPRRQTHFGRRVAALAAELGLPPDYGRRRRLPLQVEARRLASAGTDIYDRPQRLAPSAAAAWRRMRAAAADEGVRLQLVSAYRSLDYQAGIVRRKLAQGQSVAQILAVSAAPGFSEHHTGRALDLTTPGAPVLETPFETTDAFAWLRAHAGRFSFRLSYPRDNRHGLAYEPWHWRHVGG